MAENEPGLDPLVTRALDKIRSLAIDVEELVDEQADADTIRERLLGIENIAMALRERLCPADPSDLAALLEEIAESEAPCEP